MTTLYRPVLIETVEQAETLPVGTVAFLDEGTARSVAHKIGVDAWIRTDMGDLYSPVPNAAMYPGVLPDAWTALVPIEAEEEWALVYGGEDPTPCIDEVDAREWARIDGEGQAPSHRLVTPWESV